MVLHASSCERRFSQLECVYGCDPPVAREPSHVWRVIVNHKTYKFRIINKTDKFAENKKIFPK